MNIEITHALPSEFPFRKFKGEPFFDAVNTNDSAYWVWVLLQPNLWQRYPDTLHWIRRHKGRDLQIFEQAVAEAERRGRSL